MIFLAAMIIYVFLRLVILARCRAIEGGSGYGISDELLSDEDVSYWRWHGVGRWVRYLGIPAMTFAAMVDFGWLGIGCGYAAWVMFEGLFKRRRGPR